MQAEAAAGYYRKAIACQPWYAEAHCNLGVLHKHGGRMAEAVACYESALRAAPNNPLVQANLAIALTEQGQALYHEGDREGGALCDTVCQSTYSSCVRCLRPVRDVSILGSCIGTPCCANPCVDTSHCRCIASHWTEQKMNERSCTMSCMLHD